MNNFNSNYAFILHHGWGYNQHYWKNLITELLKRNVKLEDILVYEGGYYKNLKNTTVNELSNFLLKKKFQNKKNIGIGHSMGFPKLLNYSYHSDQINFDYIFGLQTMINYLGNNNQKATESYLEFVKNFRQNPSEFIRRIVGKIDLDENFCKEENLNLDLLNRDLDLLNNNMRHLFDELKKTNYHIFARRDDHVVPFNIIGENFDDKKISFSLNNCGHSLGFTECDWVLNKIFYSLSV